MGIKKKLGGLKMCQFRKLKADEIECRISQCFDGEATALLYKTARVDRAILDETVGSLNWQNDFKVIDGKMYGSISIWDKEKKQWITKSDCGTESNTEKEKGEASDCFKRAGFKWGIGVELYTAPQIKLKIETVSKGNGKFEPKYKSDKYDVKEIGYDENGNIYRLLIVNKFGYTLFSYGEIKTKQKTKVTPIKKEPEIVDSDLDIITGLAGVADIKNLDLYYKQNKDKVKDLDAFIQACKNRKAAING